MRIFLRGKHLQYNVHCRIIGYRRGGGGSNFLSNPPPPLVYREAHLIFLGAGGGGRKKVRNLLPALREGDAGGASCTVQKMRGWGLPWVCQCKNYDGERRPDPFSLEEDIYLGERYTKDKVKIHFFSKLSPGRYTNMVQSFLIFYI